MVNVYIIYTNTTLTLTYVDYLQKDHGVIDTTAPMKEKTRKHNGQFISVRRGAICTAALTISWWEGVMLRPLQWHTHTILVPFINYTSFHWVPEEGVESMSGWLSHTAGYGQERVKTGLQRANIGNEFIFLLLLA